MIFRTFRCPFWNGHNLFLRDFLAMFYIWKMMYFKRSFDWYQLWRDLGWSIFRYIWRYRGMPGDELFMRYASKKFKPSFEMSFGLITTTFYQKIAFNKKIERTYFYRHERLHYLSINPPLQYNSDEPLTTYIFWF